MTQVVDQREVLCWKTWLSMGVQLVTRLSDQLDVCFNLRQVEGLSLLRYRLRQLELRAV